MANEPAGQKKKDEKNKKTKRPTPLKRDDQSAKRNERNKIMKSRVNTAIRRFEDALKEGDAGVTKAKLSEAFSILDKASQKGVLKKNTTSRTKSRLNARVAAK